MTKCSPSFSGPANRNFKILPNFSLHPKIKNSSDVELLSINFGNSSHIFRGIGEKFVNVKTLHIRGQPIKFIESSDFDNMLQLRDLDLSANQINFVPENVFWNLTNLEVLGLYNNQLIKLPKNLFKNLKKLQTINFTSNKITFLHKDLFADLPNIEFIWAYSNPLKIIDVDFTKISSLQLIDFRGASCSDFNSVSGSEIRKVQDIINSKCRG